MPKFIIFTVINHKNMRQHIPNLITVFNLLAGCLSIIFLFSGDIILASWMIGLAAVFDFLDGFLARVLGATSDIGKVLDSLADMVYFGVAPGMILFWMIRMSGSYPDFLAYISLMIPALSAVRLAIFSSDDQQAHHFIGVPTPLNALMLASIPLVLLQYQDNEMMQQIFSNTWFLVGLTVISSLLLVAPVRIMAMKFKSFKWKENRLRFLLVLFAIVLVSLTGYLALPVLYLLYILVSFFDLRFQSA